MAESQEKFVANPKGKAPIWEFFRFRCKDGQVDSTKAYCTECKASVKLGGGTSNMSAHVRHPPPPPYHPPRPTLEQTFWQSKSNVSPQPARRKEHAENLKSESRYILQMYNATATFRSHIYWKIYTSLTNIYMICNVRCQHRLDKLKHAQNY